MKISVPSPCSESWQLMSPHGENRFCSACQKTIVDFTTKSDREILEHLKKNNGKACGRLQQSQLNRELVYSYKNPFRFTRGAIALLSAISLSGISYAQQVERKDNSGQTTQSTQTKNSDQKLTPEKFTIKGKLIDQTTAEPLVFVSVMAVGTNKTVTTDIDGYFQIELDSSKIDSLQIKFSYVGYIPLLITNITFPENSHSIDLGTRKLKSEEGVLTVGIIIVEKKKNFFQRIFNRKK